MAVDKRGRKLPKGIRQRYNDFEGRFMYQGERYLVHGKTVTETQKAMTELRYKLEHGLYVVKEKITLDKWFETWIDEYKRKQVKIGTCIRYQEVYRDIIQKRMGMKYINEIRGEHIQKLYNELSDQGYSNATTNRTKSCRNCRFATPNRKEGKTSNDKRTAGLIYGICKGELFTQLF